jgi:hypothetical protein
MCGASAKPAKAFGNFFTAGASVQAIAEQAKWRLTYLARKDKLIILLQKRYDVTWRQSAAARERRA